MNPIYETVAKFTVDTGRPIKIGAETFTREYLKKFPGESEALRTAFFAGAGYAFSLQMHFLEPGEDPTAKDLQRMSQMAKELEDFDIALREILKG